MYVQTQAATLGTRIIKSEIQSEFINLMESLLYQGRSGLRNIRLFQNIQGILPHKSPIYLIISNMSEYQSVILFNESTLTTKGKIKDVNLDLMARLAA